MNTAIRSRLCCIGLCLIALAGPAAGETLVPVGAPWRYWSHASDPGPLWTQPAFNDHSWPVGAAPLGYGNGDEATVIPFGNDPLQKPLAACFRHRFVLADASVVGGLKVRVLRDDGLIVYLNGQEVFRDNLPAGAVDFQTRALVNLGFPAEAAWLEATVDPERLRTGTNLLAVAVHQSAPASVDLGFALELLGDTTNAPAPIRIVLPADGRIFPQGADVPVAASTRGLAEPPVQVEFFADGSSLGAATAAPYALSWAQPPLGRHTLEAVAVTAGGRAHTSGPVSVRVLSNLPPSASLINPPDGTLFNPGASFVLLATASDPEGAVQRVQFYEGANFLGEDLTFLYSQSVTLTNPGTYAFTAVAIDAVGSAATSSPTAVIVVTNYPPTVALLQPADNAVVAGPGDVLLQATARDRDGQVARVEFFHGSLKLGEATGPPYETSWDGVPLGTHLLTAVVTDDVGTMATSPPVRLNVLSQPRPELVRGPYLQMGTPTALTLRWRTDGPTASRVRYGTDPAALTGTAGQPVPVRDHVVRLTGLQPATRYFYAIGSATETFATGADCFFVTAPRAPQRLRIWAIGDSGTANDQARAVRDAYLADTGARHTDVWLMLGDNAYGSGTDLQYQAAVFEMYRPFLQQAVLWPALGNHDAYSAAGNGAFPFLDIFTLPAGAEAGGVPSGSETYYAFDYGNVHFVCLDSMSVDRRADGPMCTWLAADLAANTNRWLIAYWHHPPYTKGSHDSDTEFELIEMRENAVAILEAYGVDLVLAGHSHSYERSYLLHGHYGRSDTLAPEMIRDGGTGDPRDTGPYVKSAGGWDARPGAVYVVAGSSGQTEGGALDHPAMLLSLNELGSLVIEVEDDVLNARFLSAFGFDFDTFTIVKVPADHEFRITRVEFLGVVVRLQWNSVPGDTYRIERADDLAAVEWNPVTGLIHASEAETTWVLPVGTDFPAGFYRVVRLGGE